jgi:hypothetical protein
VMSAKPAIMGERRRWFDGRHGEADGRRHQ